MAFADAGAVAASIWDDVRCPEWAESLPIDVEAAQEARCEGACGASFACMRKEMEATLAQNAAEVRQVAAAMVVLGRGSGAGR